MIFHLHVSLVKSDHLNIPKLTSRSLEEMGIYLEGYGTLRYSSGPWPPDNMQFKALNILFISMLSYFECIYIILCNFWL